MPSRTFTFFDHADRIDEGAEKHPEIDRVEVNQDVRDSTGTTASTQWMVVVGQASSPGASLYQVFFGASASASI